MPRIHVKNPLSGNINTRLRMYKVLLFKFRRHACSAVIITNFVREIFLHVNIRVNCICVPCIEDDSLNNLTTTFVF